MVALKKYDNDMLIKYLLEVLEKLKNSILEEKDLKKFSSLLKIEKILKPE